MKLLVTAIYTNTKHRFFFGSVTTTAITSKIISLPDGANNKEVLDAVAEAIESIRPSSDYSLSSVSHCAI